MTTITDSSLNRDTVTQKRSKSTLRSKAESSKIDVSNLREELKGLANYRPRNKLSSGALAFPSQFQRQSILNPRRSSLMAPANIPHRLLQSRLNQSKVKKITIHDEKSEKSRRKSILSHRSQNTETIVSGRNRRTSILAVTNNITVPKNLFKEKDITKDNKSRWEAASRKLRALVPVFIGLHNKQAMKEMNREERRRSIKSIKSVKSVSSIKSNKSVKSLTKSRVNDKTLSPDRKSKNTSFASMARRRQSVMTPKINFGLDPGMYNIKVSRFNEKAESVKNDTISHHSENHDEFKDEISVHTPNYETDSEGEHDTSIFHTSEIEEEIIQQGVLSVVSQYNSTNSK